MSAHPALTIDNLSVAYHDNVVLQGITAALPEGEVCGIIGPNGAGKSTLIKACMDIVPRLTGSVQMFGQPLAAVRQRIGYMPQSVEVDWDFPASVRDVVMMGTYGRLGWFRRPGAEQRRRVDEALEKAGISELAHRQIGQLSGGQKQRTFLARILAQDPDLFIMDEPFAGVDAASERAITDVLLDLKQQGKTILIVHHNLHTLDRFCSWAMMINKTLITCGPVDEVFTDDNVLTAYGLRAMDNLGMVDGGVDGLANIAPDTTLSEVPSIEAAS